MATDILIDPVTGLFVEDGSGGWVEVDTSQTAVMCQLNCREGEWPFDPEVGSQNAALLASSDPTSLDMLIDSSRRALNVLQRAGLISDLTVSQLALEAELGDGSLLLQWRDRASDQPVDLIYPSIGVPTP